jgi:lysine 2,3-aminomutase
MKALVHQLLRARVRPYYIYQCDLIAGSAHLRSSVRKGIEIIEALRGHTTGYAVPQFVIDAPGGGGKVPINPDYILAVDDERVLIRNYEGKVFEYPEATELLPKKPEPQAVRGEAMVVAPSRLKEEAFN